MYWGGYLAFIHLTCTSNLYIFSPIDISGDDEADGYANAEEEPSNKTHRAKPAAKDKFDSTRTKKPTNNRKPKAKKDTDAAEDGLQDDSEPQQQQKKKSVINEEEYESEDEGVGEPIQIQEFELPVNIKPRKREDKWSKKKVMNGVWCGWPGISAMSVSYTGNTNWIC